MKKLEATFGSDFAIERAEEKLRREGFKFERKPPIKLVIYARNKKEIERIRSIIESSMGYLEPIESFRSRMFSFISRFLYWVFYGITGKKKKKH